MSLRLIKVYWKFIKLLNEVTVPDLWSFDRYALSLNKMIRSFQITIFSSEWKKNKQAYMSHDPQNLITLHVMNDRICINTQNI